MTHSEYFGTMLGLGNAIQTRLDSVIRFYTDFFLPQQPIESVFVSETVGQDGERLIESLWLVTAEMLCEAHNVLTEDKFDVSPRGPFRHIILERSDFTPGEATTRSRLNVQYRASGGGGLATFGGELKASGINCDALFSIVRDVLVPNTRSV